MKKIFLIPLMTLMCSVMAWAEKPEPQPFAFNEGIAPAAQKAPVHRVKAEVAEQDVLLEYAGFSQHFTSLQAAFNALPENSTPATVTLLSDIQESYNTSAMLVKKERRVTLDLNGHTIYSASDLAGSSALIQNNGTLTITDGSVGKTGCINNQNTNPEDWVGNGQEYPYVAHNTITNCGTLNINAGTLMNYSEGGACYVVDNNSGSNDAILNVSGTARLVNTENYAVRQFCNSATHKNEVNISGGEVIGTRAVWMQLPGSDASKTKLGSFTMTAGTVTCLSEGGEAFYKYSYGDKSDNVNISISGGTINGNVLIGGGKKNNGFENVSISGGNFRGCFYSYDPKFPRSKTVEGGTFDFNGYGYWYYIVQEGEGADVLNDLSADEELSALFSSIAELEAAGWKIIPDGPYGSNNNKWYFDIYYPIIEDKALFEEFIRAGYCLSAVGAEEDLLYEVAPCHSEEVTESKTMEQIALEIAAVPGQEVSASIIEINAAADKEKAVVTVNDDIEVEGIVIKKDNNKEGQIVVESGVTLTVGNSGIVSENNDLTTVVVKPGGTIMIGNGGVDQQGNAIPVEIQSTGTESGVFLIDPNAPAEVAQAPAKVKVYTRAHKDNGIEYWQQLASPVKGSSITVTPLGELQGNHNFLTSLYSWDYATDSWVRITDGMEPISEGVYAFRGDAVWNTSDAVLKKFAAFDLINNSHASHGGVTYEFAGELVGNGDMELNFPENGFCTFGNSYTAPIDLVTLFAKITNDMQASTNLNNTNIDPCVYMYNSSADRFESVNSLGLWLKELGIMDVAFTQIPPQQAFVMNLLSGNSAQSAVDYATCVWGNPNTNKNTPIMAPSRQQAASFSAMLNIEVTDGEATDRVVLVEDEKYSEAYDNGADAEKYMNKSFNIYANAERNLAMVASDNIEGTELTFAAGTAVNYTMTFGKTMGDYVLVDRANNNQIAIVEGGIYTFAAQPNATAEARFAVVNRANAPTAIENTEIKANVKGIYTIMGQYLGENFDILPAGVYVIDGVKIVK